jgi:hypothetical protein
MDEVAPRPNNATISEVCTCVYIYILFCIIITRVPAGGGTCVDLEESQIQYTHRSTTLSLVKKTPGLIVLKLSCL